jgi:hypothetical protein
MNRILSKVVAIALFSTAVIYAGTGPDWRGTVPGDVDRTPSGGEVVGADVNLTMTLNADMQTSAHFDLVFYGGYVEDTAKYTLCNGDIQAGSYVTARDKDANGKVTAITFEFDDNETAIESGQVLNVVSGSDCSVDRNITIFPYVGKCVTVKSENGQDQSGNVDISEINSVMSGKVVEYKPDLKISCTVPTCIIDVNGVQFNTGDISVGINKRDPISSPLTNAASDSERYDCYSDGCDGGGVGPCTTVISIYNNTEHNITSFDFTPYFDGTAPTGMVYSYEINGTAFTSDFNTATTISGLDLNESMEKNITVTFTPNGTDTITSGTLKAKLDNFQDSGHKFEDFSKKLDLAKLSEAPETDFTVTYMNRKQKSFVMITAYADTPITATITDMNGKVAEATTCPSAKKNETKFIFSDEREHAGTCLVDAANAAGLADAWSVTFHVKAAVDVAAYTDLGSSGQRTLTILYPKVD